MKTVNMERKKRRKCMYGEKTKRREMKANEIYRIGEEKKEGKEE